MSKLLHNRESFTEYVRLSDFITIFAMSLKVCFSFLQRSFGRRFKFIIYVRLYLVVCCFFCEFEDDVFSFSVLNAFDANAFGSYWFETGTPTYLVHLLCMRGYSLENMIEYVTEDVLNNGDVSFTNPIPMIYQSGYLTIKGYDPYFGMYHLGFPNAEVEEGFSRFLSASA
ncbi:hypothetical protein [Bacteroides sp.]|uniref:hypothetical protein n=1 Tax=Bacteroides sp. TaxID=29523 RepID=UPI0023D14E73|nr:hypothetical protein [Bacteroides sp.]MDE6215181.1 hypothetical protein [Bacteroides sp.]